MLKTLLKSLLRRRGLELKPIGTPIRGPENYVRHLQAKGFQPGTVIDIGVAKGPPWLYLFAGAKLILVEPNPAFTPDLERIQAAHQADILPFAAGAKQSVLDLHVDQHVPSSSSFLGVSKEIDTYWKKIGRERHTEVQRVQMRPLDDLIGQAYPDPI